MTAGGSPGRSPPYWAFNRTGPSTWVGATVGPDWRTPADGRHGPEHLEAVIDRFTPYGQTTTSIIQLSPVAGRSLPLEPPAPDDVG
jgi:hypothetical protein